jgi:hypothetical protein
MHEAYPEKDHEKMKNFKTKLDAELGKLFGKYVSHSLIAGYMLRKDILNIDELTENQQEMFLDEIIDKSVSKFVSKERAEEIRACLKERLFNEDSRDSGRGRKIPKEKDFYEKEVVKEPFRFIHELFGEQIGWVFVNYYVPKANPNLQKRIELVRNFIDSVFREFYEKKEIQQIQDKFTEYLKGKYEIPKFNYRFRHYRTIISDEDDDEELSDLVLHRIENILKIRKKRRKRGKYLIRNKIKQTEADIEESIRKFFKSSFNQTETENIILDLKKRYKIYDLNEADTDKRISIFEEILTNYVSKQTSLIKFMKMRARLLNALRLWNDIE